MSDRLAQLRSLADGVGDLQHGQPGDEDHCTAADVIRWAVAEIERNTQDQRRRRRPLHPLVRWRQKRG